LSSRKRVVVLVSEKARKKGLRFLSFIIMTVFFLLLPSRRAPRRRRRRRRRKRIFRFLRRNAGLTAAPAFSCSPFCS
jgi:hypothetical protein